ncbi:MAG: protein-L-isoaspartate(D-aspartate) O-methyltransferase [Solirubrobacterales bacterium]|nr:protein-L-isoaspartate(D-aspartate) O-methyltransferase [Solirubrobacterales bacterium]
MTDFAERRAKMVDRQLRRRGISDERVLEVMGEVPRELFVPEEIRRRAYRDEALPIGHGQTISQPWIVAATLQGLGLRGEERVLEVGGGSGYTAALLARLAKHVTSVELVPELTTEARRALILAGADLDRIDLVVGDGSAGHPDGAPYDAIALHAAVPGEPTSALAQLTPGGRLVAPVVEDGEETLTLFWRDSAGAERFMRRPIAACRFVPMLGAEGFAP